MYKNTTQHTLLKINVAFALGLILPLAISFLNPAWRFAQFTPRQLIYAKDFLPLITAFWASPTHILAQLSRFLQAGVVACFPRVLAVYMFAFWVVIALARTLSGFLLCRSVGWAYPRLFNHWALYEASSGIGPALAVYLMMYGWPFHQKYRSDTMESLVIIVACLSLYWLDDAPWTYAMASITSVALWLVQATNTSYLRHRSHNPMARALDARRLRAVLQTAMLLLLLIPGHVALAKMFSNKTLQMPTTPHGTEPFLEILILSYPRPGDTASLDTLLSQTIFSYLPYADSDMAISVFTHATEHVSFTHAKEHFSKTPITFYTDMDIHADSYPSQHLHVAEAFRWASEKPSPAEWVMLVEDDFPLCGEWGWQGILAVMSKLQHDGKYGGFVGTGGRFVSHTHMNILCLDGPCVLQWSDHSPQPLAHPHVHVADTRSAALTHPTFCAAPACRPHHARLPFRGGFVVSARRRWADPCHHIPSRHGSYRRERQHHERPQV